MLQSIAMYTTHSNVTNDIFILTLSGNVRFQLLHCYDYKIIIIILIIAFFLEIHRIVMQYVYNSK